MDSDSRSYLIAATVLLFFAAYFALCETSVSSSSKTRIKTRADRGDPRAEKALFVLDHFEQAVTTLLICTNIVHILMASLVTTYVTRRWGMSAVTLSTVITTLAVFFAGEMLPKTIAKKKPESFAIGTAGVLTLLMKLLFPFASVLTAVGSFVSDHIAEEQEVSVTEEELADIIEDYSEDGRMEKEQAELLSQALVFTKKKAGEIMTAVREVQAIDISWDHEKIFDFVKGQKHSRIPVYSGSMDNCAGMLSVRRFYRVWYKSGAVPQIAPLLSRIYYTSPDTDIDELLEKMSAGKVSMAVVRDGEQTVGIVTIEDILEELVGDIYDENDREEKEVRA